MKKSLLALAALTAFAGVASAQSSVTVFGIIDAAARNVKNGSVSLKTLSTDGMGSSRLGFRGIEDIGGGLRAGFWLEGSVNVDVGGGAKTAATANGSTANGQDWQRRATVSLFGGFGELRLGRDYTPDFWNHTVFDPFGTNGVGSSTNLFDSSGSGATTVVRANNSIGYFLPAGLGGLYGQVLVSAGEGATGNKHIGGRLGYAAGPINVAVAYGKTEVTPTVDWKRINVAGSWNLGFMTLMGQYIKSDVDGGASNGRELNNYLVGGLIPFGASTLKFSYVKSDGDGPTAANRARDADQIGVGYLYSLSKRTTLYTHFSKVSNKAGANWTASTGGVANALRANSTGYEFGINHAF
jgi:predicted porin